MNRLADFLSYFRSGDIAQHAADLDHMITNEMTFLISDGDAFVGLTATPPRPLPLPPNALA